MTRTFEDKPAVREQVPVLMSLMGPSSSGKTFSALRLATGIQRVVGGDIFVGDTEARRSTHYSDQFKFRHIDFTPPHGPLDYLAMIKHCAAQGAKTVICDGFSQEHDGVGGVLETHDAELDRMCGSDYKKRQRMTMLAWARPKSERRKLINAITQMDVNLILNFRAKRKLKMVKGKDPEDLGWMAIGGDEYIYEMTTSCLLLPGCDGVPEWNPELPGERLMVKLPRQFRNILPGKQLSEDIGEALAVWAGGGAKADPNVQWTFPKGEHKGKAMGEVPVEYLTRLLDSDIPDGPLRTMAEAEMEIRVTAQADAAEGGGDE